jgi:hypothetical protein
MANARCIAVCALLSACASAPRPSIVPPPASIPAPPAADPAYDWHGLLIAPFGSVLRDMPGALHEVLQFQDESHAKAGVEDQDKDQECYGTRGSKPNFAGRKLDEYLLCFRHDRLVRIEATLRLAADQAALVLSRTCAAWADRCQGQEGDIRFSVRLAEDSGEPDPPLIVTLRAAALNP